MKKWMAIAAIILSSTVFAQSALKHNKQQTQFLYLQLNLHGGYMNDINGPRWDVASKSPNNQLAVQYFVKNKRTLQKGYIKNIALASSKVRLSIPFEKTVNSLGFRESNFKIKMLDTWLKFDTKFDRTSIWVGNKSIPYGHNPRLDPVSSFMTNMIKMDIGFVQDLGVFIKTPITKHIDMELSVTSGGFLNKPLMVCDNILNDPINPTLKPVFSLADYKYEGTWLVTSRIGSPTYKKIETGIILLTGKIRSTFITDDLNNLVRVGGDFIYKHHEKLKLSSQLTLGNTYSYQNGNFTSINAQAGVDIFLKYKFFVSSSFAVNAHNSREGSNDILNYTSANSLTYTFSPHTRLRLNHYYSFIRDNQERQSGILLQFVTGFGKRS